MANAFENYIQVELPKRPFLANDIAPESVIIRRGAGPRQLSGVALQDGQILGRQAGQIVAMDMPEIGAPIDTVVHTQDVAETTWTITHNRNNMNVVVALYDADGFRFEADGLRVLANSVVVTLTAAYTGRAVLLFTPAPVVPE